MIDLTDLGPPSFGIERRFPGEVGTRARISLGILFFAKKGIQELTKPNPSTIMSLLINLLNNEDKMKLSTRARYGTRALLDIALHEKEGWVSLKDVSGRQEISVLYLEQLIKPLAAAGLVKTTRGPRGGISLGRPPAKIRLSEVVQSLDGPIAPVECVNNPAACARSGSCVTRDVWDEVKRAISGVLASTTLQDLVERQAKKAPSQGAMYAI